MTGDENPLVAMRPIGRWARFFLRADPWPCVLLALALAFAFFWVYRSPTVAKVGLAYYHDFCLGSVLFGLIAAGRGAQLLVRNWYVGNVGGYAGLLRSPRWFWPWLLGIAGGTYFMLQYQVPMKLAFALSRPALDRLADEALADRANANLLAGRWAGLYRIAGVEVIGRTVVLYLGQDRGTYGLARVPGAATDSICNRPGSEDKPDHHEDFPKEEHFADRVGERMDGDWFVMYSWYWLVKVGWS